MIKVYLHPKCTTCQKAIAWLDADGIPYTSADIRETPPSIDELRMMLQHTGKLSKLCNTSGQDYRALGLKEKLPLMSEAEALELLAGNGMLIKRPFVLTGHGGVTGFREPEWAALFGRSAS
ncbi:MAG: arsenate reductase family protein [Opitutales bacterium]